VFDSMYTLVWLFALILFWFFACALSSLLRPTSLNPLLVFRFRALRVELFLSLQQRGMLPVCLPGISRRRTVFVAISFAVLFLLLSPHPWASSFMPFLHRGALCLAGWGSSLPVLEHGGALPPLPDLLLCAEVPASFLS
jgi:hypothetical protein